MIFRRSVAGLAVLLAATGTLAACKGKTTVGATTVVTVTAPPSSPAGSGATSGSAASTTGSPSSAGLSTSTRTLGPAPTDMTRLPGRCESLLSTDSILNAIGRSIPGKTAYVVGVADKATGRLSYLNCRYGIKTDPDDPALEIGVSLYKLAAQAAARIPATTTDFENNSATAQQTTVDGVPATLLTGGQGRGYGPTLVLSYGQRTVAVSFRDDVVSTTSIGDDLLKLASLAISRTSGR